MAKQPFLLLNKQVGWEHLAHSQGLQFAEEADELRLRRLPGESRPLGDPSGDFGGLTMPSALAVDWAGNLFVLDGHRLCRYDECSGSWRVIPGIGGKGHGSRQFWRPQSITISPQNELIVADSGNRRVLRFYLKSLSLSSILGPLEVSGSSGAWEVAGVKALPPDPCLAPEDQSAAEPVFPAGTWLPVDVAAGGNGRSYGRLYVADKANGLIHLFDRWGCWLEAWDGVDGEGAALSEPTHLALDMEGNLYIAQAGETAVTVLNSEGEFVGRVTLPEAVADHFKVAKIGFDSAGRLHISDAYSGCVFIYEDVEDDGCQCRVLPGKRPSGCLVGPVFDGQGVLHLADKLAGIVYSLEEESVYATQGYIILGPLDSEQYRCVWHRIVLEATVEEGTLIQVDTYTADAPKAPLQIQNLAPANWETNQMNGMVGSEPWDCLIRSQAGRFLWLKLTFYGDQQHSPAVGQVKVEYPRNSSLRFLPSVFREDAVSSEFLGRYLSLMDFFWSQVDSMVEGVPRLLNPMGTPVEFLPWLASWVGLTLEHNWPVSAQRELIRQAHTLFDQRGTAAGMVLLLEIITGHSANILEHFKLRRWAFLDQGYLGDQSVLWGPKVTDRLQLDDYSNIGEFQLIDYGDPLLDPIAVYSHRFSVYVMMPGADERQQEMIKALVEQAKPAHTLAEVLFVKPGLCLGQMNFLGINTLIGEVPVGVTLDVSEVGQGTVLAPSSTGDDMRLGTKVRMGDNARLES